MVINLKQFWLYSIASLDFHIKRYLHSIILAIKVFACGKMFLLSFLGNSWYFVEFRTVPLFNLITFGIKSVNLT